MDAETLDRTLARLRETVGVMSTNLVDLETDASRARLDQSPLTGTTATRWSDARRALTLLWQWFTQLNEVLEKAVQLRGSRPRLDPSQLTQLDWLVNGPSIELSTAGVPLAERDLFGPSQTTIRCSPPDLLGRMRAAFDQVVAVIGACGQRWNTLETRLAPLDSQFAEAQHLADALGEPHRPELDHVRATLDGLRQTVMCDPLAASDNAIDAVATSLGAVVDDLRRLAQLRTNLSVGLSEARTLMDNLRATTAAAADARADALAKIATPAVVDAQAVADTLGGELTRVLALAEQGDWRAAGNRLVQWTTRCRDALAGAQRALTANRAPVAARDELRGRLDAYRAKAYRMGRLEDPVVAGLHAKAKAELYTAPTDLVEAERLVRQYQQVLAGPPSREVAT